MSEGLKQIRKQAAGATFALLGGLGLMLVGGFLFQVLPPSAGPFIGLGLYIALVGLVGFLGGLVGLLFSPAAGLKGARERRLSDADLKKELAKAEAEKAKAWDHSPPATSGKSFNQAVSARRHWGKRVDLLQSEVARRGIGTGNVVERSQRKGSAV